MPFTYAPKRSVDDSTVHVDNCVFSLVGNVITGGDLKKLREDREANPPRMHPKLAESLKASQAAKQFVEERNLNLERVQVPDGLDPCRWVAFVAYQRLLQRLSSKRSYSEMCITADSVFQGVPCTCHYGPRNCGACVSARKLYNKLILTMARERTLRKSSMFKDISSDKELGEMNSAWSTFCDEMHVLEQKPMCDQHNMAEAVAGLVNLGYSYEQIEEMTQPVPLSACVDMQDEKVEPHSNDEGFEMEDESLSSASGFDSAPTSDASPPRFVRIERCDVPTPVASPSTASTTSESGLMAVFTQMSDAFKDAMDGDLGERGVRLFDRIKAVLWFAFFDWPKAKGFEKSLVVLRLINDLVGTGKLAEWAKWAYELFKEKIVTQDGDEKDEFDWFRDVDLATTGAAYFKTKKFVMALVSLAFAGAFGKELSSGAFGSIWKVCSAFWKESSIIDSIFQFAIWFAKNMRSWLCGEKTAGQILTDADSAADFDTRVARLDLLKKRVCKNDGTVTLAGYAMEVTKLRRHAERYMRVVPKAQKYIVSRQLKHILDHEIFLTNYHESDAAREAPASYLFYGPSSVGKTILVNYAVDLIQVACGVERGPQYAYHLNNSDKYMSGYGPGFNVIVNDDIANTEPQFAEQAATKSVIEIVNNEPRMATMADLDEKGRYAINPVAHIGTTNIERLNATTTSVDALSVLRRFDWHFEIRLKPGPWNVHGMMKPGTRPADHMMDIWNITAYRFARTPQGIRRIDEKDMGFPEMMEFIAQHAKQKKIDQKRLVKELSDLPKAEICEHGVHRSYCKKEHQVVQQALLEWAFTSMKFAGMRFVPGGLRARVEEVDLGIVQQHANSVFFRRMHTRWMQIFVFLSDVRSRPITPTMGFAIILYNILYMSLCLVFLKVTLLPTLVLSSVVSSYAVTLSCRLIPYICLSPCQTLACVVQQQVRLPHRQRQFKVLAGASLALTAAYLVYKTWKSTYVQPQGAGESRPIPSGVSDVRNVYTDQFIRPIDTNMNVRTMSADQVEESFKKHMMFGRLTHDLDDKFGTVCNVFPMESEHIILPYHVLRQGYKWLRIFVGDTIKCSNASRLLSIDKNWQRIGTTDLAVLYSPIIADQKDYKALLSDKVELKNNAVRTVFVQSQPDGEDMTKRTFSVGSGRANAQSCVVDVKMLDYIYDGGNYNSPVPTYRGQCCAPIFTDRVSGPTLVGFHSAGECGTSIGRFSTLTSAEYLAAKKKLHIDDIVPQSQMHERSDHIERLDYNTPNWRWTSVPRGQMTSLWVAGEYTQMGYSTCPSRKLRSNILVTDWSEVLEREYGMPRKHEAPQNIGSYVPWNMWLTNASEPSRVPPSLIKMAQKDFIRNMHEWFATSDFQKEISPLDHMATVNGVNGVKGCDPMKKTTSMGIPWTRPKSEFMKPVDEDVENIADPFDFSPDIKRAIEELRDILKSGRRAYVPHRCNLKDEAVKIGSVKVRVFLGSSLPFLYLMRQYFLPISMFMQKHPISFETGVGINCYGKQWTRIAQYLTKFGLDRLIAGDYAKYDQKMEIALTKAAFEILLWICEQAGYDEETMTICRGLMTETIAGCYDLRGEWIGLTSSNPSGHALTVIINSIVNSLYMRCAFYALRPVDEERDFRELVTLLTYGDDNIMGVHTSAQWFTHTSVSRKLKEWNIDYTMADKETESTDYIHITQATFLKRGFVERDGIWYAPLAETSIMKTLHTYLKSSAIDVKEQHAQLLMAANREYFLYGKQVFEAKREMLMDLAVRYQVDHFFQDCRLDDWVSASLWFAEQ